MEANYEQDFTILPGLGQRTTDLVIFEDGEKAGVKTCILMSPTIYGIGTGLFNRTSIQINSLIRAAQRGGFTPVIGKGDAEWDHVHIEDLAGLYELILARILNGDDLPSGARGVYFNETGHHSWREVSERIAKAGKETGFLVSEEIREIGLEEGGRVLQKPLDVVELGFASNSRTRADRAREIGWAPQIHRESGIPDSGPPVDADAVSLAMRLIVCH
ncbi:NAD dependent epimerase/dehydratase family protein [Penicillium psychrosexuale]|uniref:NAD dependent epimerase/dehydratase family protein n=1 Tax=Penicillium psychrosexuale TaxID=1002107 RepID=UPI002544EFD7|nr:NAD dependent epimerase/dehydratase family protein [Penicillium psychrosexuale]KAJ5803702.1 NAD dependent epimerase/dehydratase family protein [Penicillium psychrosexuale]